MSKLAAHSQEITTLLDAGHSQAEIIRLFGNRGITIPRSTLSDFVRQQQEGEVAVATMDDEGLSERFAAALSLQRSVADELLDRMVDVIEGVQQLKREGDERHTAILAAINAIEVKPASPAEDINPLLEAAVTRLDRLAARTGGAALRWVWLKAFLLTGLAWTGLLAGAIHTIYVLDNM